MIFDKPLSFAIAFILCGFVVGVLFAPMALKGTAFNREKIVYVWTVAEKYGFKNKDINLITDLFLVENGCMGSTTTVFYFNMDGQTDYYCVEITGVGK